METTECVFFFFLKKYIEILQYLKLLTRVSLNSYDRVVSLFETLFKEEISLQNQTLWIPNTNSIFSPH